MYIVDVYIVAQVGMRRKKNLKKAICRANARSDIFRRESDRTNEVCRDIRFAVGESSCGDNRAFFTFDI